MNIERSRVTGGLMLSEPCIMTPESPLYISWHLPQSLSSLTLNAVLPS